MAVSKNSEMFIELCAGFVCGYITSNVVSIWYPTKKVEDSGPTVVEIISFVTFFLAIFADFASIHEAPDVKKLHSCDPQSNTIKSTTDDSVDHSDSTEDGDSSDGSDSSEDSDSSDDSDRSDDSDNSDGEDADILSTSTNKSGDTSDANSSSCDSSTTTDTLSESMFPGDNENLFGNVSSDENEMTAQDTKQTHCSYLSSADDEPCTAGYDGDCDRVLFTAKM